MAEAAIDDATALSQPEPAEPQTPVSSRQRRFHRRRLLLLVAVPLAAAAAALAWWLLTAGTIVTENAYVKAEKLAIGAEIGGRVASVLVRENQRVAAGEPLFRLEDEMLRIALARAEAGLQTARNQVAALRASLRETQEKARLATANLEFAERDFRRQSDLAARRVVADSRLDESEQRLAGARQQLAVLRQEEARLLAELSGDPEIATERHPLVRAARAMVREAALQLGRSEVRAPATGVVSRTDNLRPGDVVRPGVPLFSLVAIDRPWIEANLKETELRHLRLGQTARVRVDAYPDAVWTARVESIGAATGAEFSLLPPQNATGNWVKVVQRLPVRLALQPAPDLPQLRAGMSAEVTIETGEPRRLPFIGAIALPGTGPR